MLQMLEKLNAKGISLATLIIVLGVFANQVRWQTKIESRIVEAEKHAADKEKHPSYLENSVLFVPRPEIEIKLTNIEKTVERIDKKLDER